MGVTARDKVSDLRAGLVNPNSTNVVSRELARRFWKGESSGLRPYDIITPSRASKNIGEPVMLLPGVGRYCSDEGGSRFQCCRGSAV